MDNRIVYDSMGHPLNAGPADNGSDPFHVKTSGSSMTKSAAIKAATKMYKAGLSTTAIFNRLRDDGYRTTRGSLTEMSVRRLIQEGVINECKERGEPIPEGFDKNNPSFKRLGISKTVSPTTPARAPREQVQTQKVVKDKEAIRVAMSSDAQLVAAIQELLNLQHTSVSEKLEFIRQLAAKSQK